MNLRIRKLEEDIIALLNQYTDVEIEVKRLVLESVLGLAEKKADKTIREEIESNAESTSCKQE